MLLKEFSHFPEQPADFIGKAALERILSGESNLENKLVMLTVDSKNVDPEGNETVWLDNKVR